MSVFVLFTSVITPSLIVSEIVTNPEYPRALPVYVPSLYFTSAVSSPEAACVGRGFTVGVTVGVGVVFFFFVFFTGCFSFPPVFESAS